MKLAAVICSAVMFGTSAHAAETYPMKPVRMIVPYVAGGNADIQARYIAERLSEALGKQFVVDNRGGANGMIGLELAARSPADGYTAGARSEHVHREPVAVLEGAVRHDQGFPADLARRGDAGALHRQHRGRREQREGGHRAREKPPRAAQLRLDRERLALAPCRARCSR